MCRWDIPLADQYLGVKHQNACHGDDYNRGEGPFERKLSAGSTPNRVQQFRREIIILTGLSENVGKLQLSPLHSISPYKRAKLLNLLVFTCAWYKEFLLLNLVNKILQSNNVYKIQFLFFMVVDNDVTGSLGKNCPAITMTFTVLQ